MPSDYSFDQTAVEDSDAWFIASVRVCTDDKTNEASPVEGKDFFLTDKSILALRSGAAAMVSGAWALVYQASALALTSLSTNQAYVLKKKTTMGQDIDGPAVSASIRADAKMWEERAKAANLINAQTAGTASYPMRPGSVVVPVQSVYQVNTE